MEQYIMSIVLLVIVIMIVSGREHSLILTVTRREVSVIHPPIP